MAEINLVSVNLYETGVFLNEQENRSLLQSGVFFSLELGLLMLCNLSALDCQGLVQAELGHAH